MSKGNVLLGVLAGIAAGATLGILFAPDKGSRTRREITEKGEDYADELKDKFDDFRDSLSDKFDQVKSKAEAFVSKSKNEIHEAKKAIENSNA